MNVTVGKQPSGAAAVALIWLAASPLSAQAGARYAGLPPDVFMRSWLVLGPVPIGDGTSAPDEAAQESAFDADLLASCGGEAGVSPRPEGTCSIGGTDYRFQPIASATDIVDLARAVGGRDHAVAYAAAEVESAETARVLVGLASDDAIKVWLNGALVHRKWVHRPARQDQDLVSLELRSGRNRILVKVQNGTGAWAFAARAVGRRGLQEDLWDAARLDDVDAVQAALASGGDLDLEARPKWGLTAWQVARVMGSGDAADALAAAGAGTTGTVPPRGSIVDAMLSEAIIGRVPGAAVLVARDGTVVFEKGYGYASLEREGPITPTTKFRIGSVTKQFTAAAILRLQEQGKLSVDDPLSRYWPGFPRGEEVTLRHLLTHTSGIHSYTDKPGFRERTLTAVAPEALIRSFENDPYDFDPGTRWSYSNSGYFLLGAIVAKVSGQPYAAYLDEQFFAPLGMKDTGVHVAGARLENEATGYAQEEGTVERAPDWDMSWAGGAGALYSTVEDLARWNEAVFGGKVLGEASLAAAFTPVRVGAPPPGDEGYGYGWGIGLLRGLREIQHGGGLAGYASQLSRYPSERLTVVVLANALPPMPGVYPGEIARNVAQIYLADRMDARRRPRPIALSPEALERFVGRYDYRSGVLAVTRDGDRLFGQLPGQPRLEIFPSSANEFFWKAVDARVTFVEDESGRVVKALHRQGGASLEAPRLEEREAIELAPATLDACVGRYDYGEGKVILSVERDGSRLFVQLTGQPRFEVFPASENEFFLKVVEAKITFVKDGTGKVTGVIHEQGGRRFEAPRIE